MQPILNAAVNARQHSIFPAAALDSGMIASCFVVRLNLLPGFGQSHQRT